MTECHAPGCNRQAEHGHLCPTHRGRLARAILTAPELTNHIRNQRTPTGGAPDQPHTTGTRTPPAPTNLGALDDADTIHAATHNLAATVAQARDLTGPRRTGSWIANGRVLGLSTDATTADTNAPAEWLKAHVDWLAAWKEGIPDLFDPAPERLGYVALIERLTSRWPTATSARRLPLIDCPHCNRRGTLIYHPPTWATTRIVDGVPVTDSDDVVIQCGRAECGYLIPDDRIGWFARLAEDLALERTTTP